MYEHKQAKLDHSIHELLAQRWSPYAFSDRQVSDDDLRLLFEAARSGSLFVQRRRTMELHRGDESLAGRVRAVAVLPRRAQSGLGQGCDRIGHWLRRA